MLCSKELAESIEGCYAKDKNLFHTSVDENISIKTYDI